MQTHLHSCANLGANVWLLARPTTLSFHLSLVRFLTTLHTHLGLPHPIVAHLSWCQCGHTIDDLGTYLLQCPLEVNVRQPTTHFKILFQLLFWKVEHMSRGRFPTFSFTTPENKWIFLPPNMTFKL
jgi:hypothetical protein